MEGYKALPELMNRGGQHLVFSMLGAGNVPWIAHGVQEGTLRLVRMRHEEGAVDAAAGYAKSTGEVGLCSVIRGPGFANSINALATAVASHYPLLMVVGESPTTKEASRQQLQQREIVTLLGAGFHHVAHASELEEKYFAALHSAQWGGCPQVLSIADGILDAQVSLSAAAPAYRPPVSFPIDSEAIEASASALHHAKHPLILAGQGAVVAGCRADLEDLAELVGARLASTLLANRFFSGHPRDLGMCGSWSAPMSREVIAQTDVVLAVGASLNDDTTIKGTAFGSASIIHCEVDPEQACRATRPEFALIGDARDVVPALIESCKAHGWQAKPPPSAVASWSDNRVPIIQAEVDHSPGGGLDPRWVIDAIEAKLPADRLVVVDAGRNVGGPLYAMLNAKDSNSWIPCNAFGSIGRALGTAVGAAAAHPSRTVVAFCGDGGFMMAAQQLDAVRLNDLHLVVVVLNDGQLGSEVKHLTSRGLSLDIITQTLPDVEHLARAFNGTGIILRDRADIDALRIPDSGLVLIDARVNPSLNVREAMS